MNYCLNVVFYTIEPRTPLMAHNYYDFNFFVGVSAGSTNLVGYLSKQVGRSEKIIKKYATSSEFINLKRYIKGGTCAMSGGCGEAHMTMSRYIDHFSCRFG